MDKASRDSAAQATSPLLADKFVFEDLVDLPRLQELLEKFSKATGFTTGLLSHPDLKLLVKTGWRDVCTRFHRANTESFQHCLASNKFLLDNLGSRREPNIKLCENGLVDGAVPIIVRGRHVASLATGQALFAPPDMERFARQAERYGFERETYLKAVREVPIVSEEQFRKALSFLSEMATMIAEQALANLEVRETAAALHDSEKRFRGLFENSPDAVIVEDREGRVLDANPAACHLHKLTRDQLVGRHVLDLVPVETRETVAREFPRWFTGELGFYEGHTHTADGRTIPVEIRGAPISYQGREAVLLHVRDNSARNQMREQLLQSQKMEAVGRLAGGVAHDFNNLLMVIGGWTELAMAKPGNWEHALRWHQEVNRAVDKGAALARQLLAFSRRQVMQPEALDLAAHVENSRQMLQTMLGERNRIEVRAGRIEGRAWMDPTQATQILMNLASNARDAIGEDGGTLSLEVSQVTLGEQKHGISRILPPGNYARLVVKDTGCGMDEATKARVFEPFFTTKPMGKGTGLGLSTVYGIVRQAGGDISVASAPGAGTTFTILLPFATGEQTPASSSSPQERGDRGDETVLLVEDEDGVRSSVEETLRAAGYRVISATDGNAAWRVCQAMRGKLDLLLTDVIMPGLRGDELARRVRQRHPETCVILMSGYLDERIRPETLSFEGFSFVQKPVRSAELLRRIREVLDSQAGKSRRDPSGK